MMYKRTFFSFLVGAAMAAMSVLPASAMYFPAHDLVPDRSVIQIGDGCYAVGQKVARQRGGQLAKASAQKRGGKTVCVVVVLVPGGYGSRPSRQEIVVPYR